MLDDLAWFQSRLCADQIEGWKNFEIDPELKGHIKAVKQRGWKEVQMALARNGRMRNE